MRSAAGHGLPPPKKANSGRFGSVCAPLRGSKLAEPPPQLHTPTPIPSTPGLSLTLCAHGVIVGPTEMHRGEASVLAMPKRCEPIRHPNAVPWGSPSSAPPPHTPHPTASSALCFPPPSSPQGVRAVSSPLRPSHTMGRGAELTVGSCWVPPHPQKTSATLSASTASSSGWGLHNTPTALQFGTSPPHDPTPRTGTPQKAATQHRLAPQRWGLAVPSPRG